MTELMKIVDPGKETQHEAQKTKEIDLFNRLRVFVRVGLLEFWRCALPEDQVIVPMLKREAIAYTFEENLDWPLYKSRIQNLVESAKTDFSKKNKRFGIEAFIEDYQLQLSDLFIVALLGELESSHSINLAVAELQAPDKSAHLSVHMAAALIETLFDKQLADEFVFGLGGYALIQDQLVTLTQEGPLPLCKLKMRDGVWPVLAGKPILWPGCYVLKPDRNSAPTSADSSELEKYAGLITREGEHNIKGLVIRGVPASGRRDLACELAAYLGCKPLLIPAEQVLKHKDRTILCRYAGLLPVIKPQLGPGETFRLSELRAQCSTPPFTVVIMGTEGSVDAENVLEIRTSIPSQEERVKLWQQELKNKKLAQQLGACTLLSGRTIRTLAKTTLQLAEKDNRKPGLQHLHHARWSFAAENLNVLAQAVKRQVDEKAISLSPSVKEGIDLLLLRARNREGLWQHLGHTLKSSPNSGLRALFVGESGTGKTLAASYIASQLATPLYRVDLSSVMNKYIGESEKNLSQLLDHAASSDVILLFDEADSLFGSRSDGKENGERFANMLTNFLLTRIENHPGIVILTTNGKERIDNAFSRRIDVEIDFPLPNFDERLQLWQSHLGNQGPNENVCQTIASYCDFSGGQIRNAVLAAATYAQQEHIHPELLVKGIRLEYGKLGRPVPKPIEQLARFSREEKSRSE